MPSRLLAHRKLGLPEQPELAMGAIASGSVRVMNPDVVADLGIPKAVIEAVARREQQELERRERIFRGHRSAIDPAGRTVILVDDGLATGSTMRAAIEIVCPIVSDFFFAAGQWYDNFSQTMSVISCGKPRCRGGRSWRKGRELRTEARTSTSGAAPPAPERIPGSPDRLRSRRGRPDGAGRVG